MKKKSKQFVMNIGIRSKILLSFILVALLSFSAIFVYFIIDSKRKAILDESRELNHVLYEIYLANNTGQKVLLHDIHTKEFYTKPAQQYKSKLAERNKKVEEIHELLELHQGRRSFKKEWNNVENRFKEYDTVYNELIDLLRTRGWKDYGLVGQMRTNIHQIEEMKQINSELYLSVRRHEKDYFLRGDSLSAQRAIKASERLKSSLLSLSSSQQDTALQLLTNYENLFKAVIENDLRTGILQNGGMLAQLDGLSNAMSSTANESRLHARQYTLKYWNDTAIVIFITLSLIAILVLGLTLFLARRLTDGLRKISFAMKQFTVSDFSQRTVVVTRNESREIVDLADSYNTMSERLYKILNKTEVKANITKKLKKEQGKK